jgi:hypothetical protein
LRINDKKLRICDNEPEKLQICDLRTLKKGCLPASEKISTTYNMYKLLPGGKKLQNVIEGQSRLSKFLAELF